MSQERLEHSLITLTADFGDRFAQSQKEFQAFGAAASVNNEVWSVLARYGGYQICELPSGERVIVLATCAVPLTYFVRENWQRVIYLGNFREVKAIDRLSDGTDPRIVVKSPERVFTKEQRLLEKGYPWWSGERSGQRRTCISGNPVVEEQAVWEAIVLLELRRQGVRTEIPQAFIESLDGKRELVVRGKYGKRRKRISYFP